MSDEGEYRRYEGGDDFDRDYGRYHRSPNSDHDSYGSHDSDSSCDSDCDSDEKSCRKSKIRGKPKCNCGDHCGDKCKPIRRKCRRRKSHRRKCAPKYCEKISWPPCRPSKKGDDICAGDIDANDIKADVVKAPPEKIYVPGRRFGNLGDALRAVIPPEQGGPIGGYHVVLKSGCHDLGTDHNLAITNLVLEAERWSPVMSNPYFVGHGHSMRTVTRYFDFYDKCTGGVGPYCIDVCKNRITVTSHHRRYSPNFDSLCNGDVIYWRNHRGRIKCYKVKRGKCNSIWIYGCLDVCKPQLGEGFWVGNTTTIRFLGQRQLLLSPGGNLQYRGIHLSMLDDEYPCKDRLLQIITGTSNGVTNLMHSHLEDNMLLYGGPSWLTPNIVMGRLRLTAGSTGTLLYTGFINPRARTVLDQSLALFAATLYLGNEIGVESWGSAAANVVGSTVHGCKIGAKVVGGSFNCPGTIFSACETAIQARSSGKVISNTTEFDGLAPLALIACQLALDFDNKIAGESDVVLTRGNGRDLSIDGELFGRLSDYPSGQFQSRASTFFYEENIGDD
jgi:hypothetical protein